MATFRVGVGSFNIQDGAVGFGTDTDGLGNLKVKGVTKTTDIKVSGASTLTRYSGFAADNIDQLENITLTSEVGTIGDIVVGVGTSVIISSASTVTVGTVESVSIGTHFSPPVGGIEDRGEDFVEGMMRFNTDFNTMEFYNGDEWRQFNYQLDITNSPGSRGRAIICGGSSTPNDKTSDIDAVNITTKGNATRFGQMQTEVYAPAAFASEIRGIIYGGQASPQGTIDTIDYVTMASEGNGIDFGNMNTAYVHSQGCSSSTRGVAMGDYNQSNTMSYVQIATTGNALDFGDLLVGRHTATCAASPIHGFCAAGNAGDNIKSIERIRFSTKGNAISFGDLSEVRGSTPAGASNSHTAIFALGRNISSILLNTIETMNMSTQGSATSFGDIAQAGTQVTGAASSPTRVIVMGGMMAPNNTQTDAIHSITISSSGGSEDFGNLTRVKTYHYATSDCHGGLGGY